MLLAVALTIAALVFIVAAMGGIDQHAQSRQVHGVAPQANSDK